MVQLRWILLVLIACLPAAAVFAEVKVYTSNEFASSVSVIDADSNTVIATVAAGSNPGQSVATSDGSKVYVPVLTSNSVIVIDTATDTIIDTIAVGSSPLTSAISHDGMRVFVLNFVDQTISVINTVTDSVDATIPVMTAGFLYILPDDSKLYVGLTGGQSGSSVSRIDLTTQAYEVREITNVGMTPFSFAATPDSATLYVANTDSSTVAVINTETDSVVDTIPVGIGPHIIGINPSGTEVYVPNNDSGTVDVISTVSNEVVATIQDTPDAFLALVTPDGAKVFVTGENSSSVYVIDTATHTLTQTIAVGTTPRWIVFDPSGEYAYVSNFSSGNVSVIDVASEVLLDQISTGITPYYLTILDTEPEPPVTPELPINGQGEQVCNRFLTQTEFVNLITWQAPEAGPVIVQYRIYKDASLTDLLAVLPADGPLEFAEHGVKKGLNYVYYVVSEDELGDLSSPLAIAIN